MKFGWPISLLLHAVVLTGSLLALSSRESLDADSRIIPVEILTVDDLTNIRASVKAKTPEQASGPMQLETPMKNADNTGEARERSNPAETPAPPPTSDEDADEAQAPKPEPDKPAFDLDNMSALVDKTREAQPEKNQQQALQSEKNLYEFASVARERQGLGTELSISELDALKSAMYKCWRIPLDAKNPEELVVRVRVALRSDGHVTSVDLLDKARIGVSNNPYMSIAAQRAVNAVSKCAPYDFLPLDKYDRWKDMTLRFKPEI